MLLWEFNALWLANENAGKLSIVIATTVLLFTPPFLILFVSRDLKGVIVTLDDTGYLHCAYLGTDPSMMVTPAPEARDINYEVRSD